MDYVFGHSLLNNAQIVFKKFGLEHSEGLAPLIVQELRAITQEIVAEGITVLLVEQNASQALQVAHRGYVLEIGRIVLTGPGQELLNDEKVKQAYLGT